jgi:hypothetical protein
MGREVRPDVNTPGTDTPDPPDPRTLMTIAGWTPPLRSAAEEKTKQKELPPPPPAPSPPASPPPPLSRDPSGIHEEAWGAVLSLAEHIMGHAPSERARGERQCLQEVSGPAAHAHTGFRVL